MIKNLTISVTSRCNSRCKMCHIWKIDQIASARTELSAQQYDQFFSNPVFSNVEEINLTGGEPTLRDDLNEVASTVLTRLPLVRRFFVTSNASNKERIVSLAKVVSEKIPETFLCLSLEGDRETNKMVRGVDSYKSVSETIALCKRVCPDVAIVLSTTLSAENCNLASLDHIRRFAEESGARHSFRFAQKNDGYYHNDKANIEITNEQLQMVSAYIKKHHPNDLFLGCSLDLVNHKRVPLMDNCKAGDIFAFVRHDGAVLPCINSTRVLGDRTHPFKLQKITDLGKHETCPCCTECTFYPMQDWKQHATFG